MVEIILHFLGLILCILGLAEVLHSLKLYLLTTSKKRLTYSVIVLNNSSAAEQLKYAFEQQKWHGKRYADHIIAITDYLDNVDEKLLNLAKLNGIIVCSFKELKSVISYFNKGRLQ